MGNMSNRDRIARAAEEARLTQVEKAEKAAKKPAKATPKPRTKAADKTTRMKIVWEVRSASGKAVKTFPYPEKALAEAALLELTRSTGRTHLLHAAKVPMD